MEQQAMKRMMEVPGVKSAISGVGRGESPADPAGPERVDAHRQPQAAGRMARRAGPRTTIAGCHARESSRSLPGVQVVMAQPISDRVDEMVTGVRSDVAVKVFGDDLGLLKKKAEEIARVAAGIAGATDIRVERVTGQQYLSIEIDRSAIARHGLNVSDVNDVIEAAIGGKQATEVYRGRAALCRRWCACPSVSATTWRRSATSS
jgi:cobalt-zinc-cadmium resistance protein CzcA